MSLQLAAQHLAAQGRGPDKNLVHMSPREVAGLQALAKASGGSLSINPKTGLPEAGFLENMLPMLLGVGAMALTGGAAAPAMAGLFGMGMPATIGLGIGALQTARTGSLEKGLMAGLGAYGGAGLAGGLMAAGAGAAGTAAGTAGAAGAEAAAAGAAGAGAGTAGAAGAAGATAPGIDVAYDMLGAEPFLDQAAGVTGGAASGAPVTVGGPMGPSPSTLAQPTYIPPYSAQPTTFSPPSYGAGAEGTLGELQAQQAMQQASAMPAPIPAATPASTAPATPMPEPVDAVSRLSDADMALRQQPAPSFGGNLSQMGRGIQALGSPEGQSAFMSEVGKGKGLLQYGLASAAPLMQSQKPKRSAREKDYEQMRFVYDPGRVEDPEADYTGAASGERRYFNPTYRRYALGGPVEAMSAANVYDMQNARGGVSDMGIDNSTGMQRMAGGGISHLGDYSDGGRLLKGPGDGVSDSIPAVIGNKQPARLADGEFVVPARIVSELGNGSTDAGARKLYAMMDRIQKARNKTTGKNRVAANTRSEKYLPA